MTPAQKDAAVLAVLTHEPQGLFEVLYAMHKARPAARAWPYSPGCLPVVLQRIGAVRAPGKPARYSAPAVVVVDAERPKALPGYVCAGCHKPKTDYVRGRGRGDQRWCSACVGFSDDGRVWG